MHGCSGSNSHTPYNYAVNNPISLNDPSGGYVGGFDPGRVFADQLSALQIGKSYSQLTGNAFSSGGHWSDQYRSYGLSAGDFINSALNSQYGGSWSNGQGHFFTSHEEGFFAGVEYNNYHNSWGNTQHGSRVGSMLAYMILRDPRPITTVISEIISVTQKIGSLNLSASSAPTYDDDFWNPSRSIMELYLRILYGLPNAISVGGQVEGFAVTGGVIERGKLYVLATGLSSLYVDSGNGLGIDGGAAVNFTLYYYLNLSDTPYEFTLNDHNGPRYSLSGDINFFGVLSVGLGFSIAPTETKGAFIVSRACSVGVGVEGTLISGNGNFGFTKLDK